MDAFEALFNTVLVVFIVATMLTAGFSTTFEQLRATFSKVLLVLAVLLVGLILRPLVGWGAAELFGLAAPAFIAMVLLWSCPGAPFGSKLVMTARADIQSGAALQVLLAVVGSITFAPTANAILSASADAGGVSLPVADLILTVAVLQLVPFAVGILTRHWARETALQWSGFSQRVSNISFIFVLAGGLAGSWRAIVALVGSQVILATILASATIIVLGYVVSAGPRGTRRATALIQPCTNAGPAFAAVAIAFGGDPEILGAVVTILIFQIVVGLPVATYFAQGRSGTAHQEATI